MNKKSIPIYLAMVFFLSSCMSVIKKEDVLLQAQQIKAATPPELISTSIPKHTSLPNSEKLVYKAKYLGITIGEYIILNKGKTTLNGQEAYHFELIVKVLPFFAQIFKAAKLRYVSYMDTQKLRVLRHEEYIHGGTLLESAVDFDYLNHTASYKNFINLREEKVAIPDQILDTISGGFYLRMVPWSLGDTLEINIYADEKIYSYIGLLHSKIIIDVPANGKQEAYLLKPYLFIDGEQITKISAEIFLFSGASRKPLRAVLRTRFGNIRVVLTEGFKD